MIAMYGCNRECIEISLVALRRLAMYFSAEDAIRPFFNSFPDEALSALLSWTSDADYRVRRLASEGTRPRLPWSPRVGIPAEAATPILDNLVSDESRFVTRSVANHVNDIAQADPELALSLLRKWSAFSVPPSDFGFIARQGLRSLVKDGHRAAFEFLGYSPDPQVTVTGFRLDKKAVTIGDFVEFTVGLAPRDDGQLLVDYILSSPNSAGTGRNSNVYRMRALTATAGEPVHISKKHTLRPAAGRPVRPGVHQIAIQVNGTRLAVQDFNVLGAGP